MITNYLKVAVRVLLKHKIFSLINVFGLAIGVAGCILISRFVLFELSFDRYHSKGDRIFRLVNMDPQYSGGGIAKVAGPAGILALENIPAVENMVRFEYFGERLFRVGERKGFENQGLYADPSVFNIFDFNLIAGSTESALEAGGIVLTEKLATKYFGDEDPIGKTIVIGTNRELPGREGETGYPLTVTGLMEDVPENSHFTFEFLVSPKANPFPTDQTWQRTQHYTYLLLANGSDPGGVETAFSELVRTLADEEEGSDLFKLQRLTDIHLHSNLFRELDDNSDVATVMIFSFVALFVFAIACINFMNLSTARSATRMREVGIRKVNGANRMVLVRQFIGESVLTSGFAVLLSVVLVELALPFFNELTGLDLSIDFADPLVLVILLAITLVVGVLAGSYPAFYLASFRPALVLKGGPDQVKGKRLLTVRKLLVVFQFSISIFLIVSTIFVYRQQDFVRGQPLGFNKDEVVILRIRSDEARRDIETFKQTLMTSPHIKSVTASGNLFGGGDWGIPAQIEGETPGDELPTRMLIVDYDFVETYEMEIVAGRDFSREAGSDEKFAYLVNETTVRQLGWRNPIGKRISMTQIGREAGSVVGVLKDFHFRSLHEEVGPILFFVKPEWFGFVSIRVARDHVSAALEFIEAEWQKADPVNPFEYTFLDERFERLYQSEKKLGSVFGTFAGLGILVACLGLFGLASYTAERRTKEIGIRKTLGAQTPGIIFLLTGDFLKLVVVANFVAWPAAFFAVDAWLQNFAYKTAVSPGPFLLAATIAVGVAVVTISYQAFRVSMANPVDALRYE